MGTDPAPTQPRRMGRHDAASFTFLAMNAALIVTPRRGRAHVG